MKLLIADDEKIIRQGIVNCFRWSDFGIEAVFQAKNGKEALEIYRQEKPDIILTDICMPFLDGLALVEEIRREGAAVQVVYITGFSDLEYLRAAVKNTAVDYIMKPVDPEELRAAVNKAVQNCHKTLQAEQCFLELERLALQSRPLLTKQLLLSLLRSSYPSKEAVAEKAKLLGLPFDLESTFMVSVISVQREKEIPLQYDDSLFSAGFENIAAEILGRQARGFVFNTGGLEFVAVACADDGGEPLVRELLKKIQQAVRHYLYAESYIVVGPAVEGLINLQESYTHAQAGLTQQFRFPQGALVSYEDCLVCHREGYQLETARVSEIVRKIYSGNLGGAQADTEELIERAAAHMATTESLQGFCLLFFSRILSEERKALLSQEEIKLFLQLAESLGVCQQAEEQRACVSQAVAAFYAGTARGFLPRRSLISSEIKAYICSHLEDSPTIKEIAAQVFLAPTYVCALFKEETGQTINAFMVKEKMEKAQFLFCKGNLRVYEVSKMVGYQDVKYFSRTFKEYTGLTPTAYAEKAGKKLC